VIQSLLHGNCKPTLAAIQNWFKKWRIKANGSKSIHVTFTTRREMFPPVHINSVQLYPKRRCQVSWAAPRQKAYLAQTHFCKTETTWNHSHQNVSLLGRNSKLSTGNKLLIYKTLLKPIWTYGIQLWGMASTSNIEILERFQSKALIMIVDSPWYVPNTVIRRDLQIPTVK
jgi:hypothetical protein